MSFLYAAGRCLRQGLSPYEPQRRLLHVAMGWCRRRQVKLTLLSLRSHQQQAPPAPPRRPVKQH
jgi:hypothetical protein